MKYIIAILAVVLLLAACSQTTTTTTTSGIPQTGKQATTTDLAQIKSDTLAKNDVTQNLVIPLNIKKGKAGDTFVFGSVFNLVNMKQGNYVVKLDFVEGRDSSYNRIELSREAGNAWVQASGSFAATTEPNYVPITIKAGSTAQLGTYTFDVYAYTIDSGFENKIDGINKKVNVKIE